MKKNNYFGLFVSILALNYSTLLASKEIDVFYDEQFIAYVQAIAQGNALKLNGVDFGGVQRVNRQFVNCLNQVNTSKSYILQRIADMKESASQDETNVVLSTVSYLNSTRGKTFLSYYLIYVDPNTSDFGRVHIREKSKTENVIGQTEVDFASVIDRLFKRSGKTSVVQKEFNKINECKGFEIQKML